MDEARGKESVLTHGGARAYYDRFGRKQDWQGFYENPAIDDLITHAGFDAAQTVFEFGCGTGRLGERLLSEHLPGSARYVGCDISSVMIGIAAQRLAGYGERARLVHTEGEVRFPMADRSIDRVVSTYVLDLLSSDDIGRFFSETHRVLSLDGRLCLASLTFGVSALSRIVASVWTSVFRLRPSLVGGCRPVRLEHYARRDHWRIEHRHVVSPYGVPSEVLILAPREDLRAASGGKGSL